MDKNLSIHATPGELFQSAAQRLVAIARDAIAEHGGFHLALAGGSTPKGLYRLLSEPGLAGQIPWERFHIYFGDERCVPPDHPDSNYRMARENLLDRVPIPAAQIHRMEGEREPAEAAARYAGVVADHLPADEGRQPRFDLILLGMGPDGHVASLFPDTPILEERNALAAAVYVEKFGAWRISLTLSVINSARHVLILVSGEGKAQTLARVLDGPIPPVPLPVQRVQPSGGPEWFIDRAAAQDLKGHPGA